MAGSLAIRTQCLKLCKPQFRLFFALVFLCCGFLYLLLTSDLLHVRRDPNSDAIQVEDGVCRWEAASGEEIAHSTCIHPHQFAFDIINRVHKTAVLTLFTFIRESSESANNSIADRLSAEAFQSSRSNWAALAPWIIPVVFMPCNRVQKINNVQLETSVCLVDAKEAFDTGIKLVNGFAAITDLFQFVTNHSRYLAPFIGYIEPSVLLDVSIVESLLYVSRLPQIALQGQGLLIVGRAKWANSGTLIKSQVKNLSYVGELYRKGSLINSTQSPYVIATRTGFPWNVLPKLLTVSSQSLTNHVIIQALLRNITIIDATMSLNCIRGTIDRVTNLSYNHKESQVLLCGNHSHGQTFTKMLALGQTACGQYFTKRGLNGAIMLYKRTKRRSDQCQYPTLDSVSSPWKDSC